MLNHLSLFLIHRSVAGSREEAASLQNGYIFGLSATLNNTRTKSKPSASYAAAIQETLKSLGDNCAVLWTCLRKPELSLLGKLTHGQLQKRAAIWWLLNTYQARASKSTLPKRLAGSLENSAAFRPPERGFSSTGARLFVHRSAAFRPPERGFSSTDKTQ